MNKSTYLLAVSAIMLMPAFTSCGGDDPDDTEFNNSQVPWDGKSERAYLEETSTTFLDYFNPGDQRTLIQSLDYLVHICRESGLPEFFPDMVFSAPLLSGDPADTSRAAADMVISFSQMKGFYQHNANTMAWQKLEDSDDLRLRYWDNESEYNLSVSGSHDTWSTTFVTGGSSVQVDVPKVLDIALVSGSTSVTNPNTILTIKLKTDFKDSERLSMSAEIKAANIFIETSASGSNNSVDVNITVSIDNVQTYYRYTLFSTKAHIAGGNLCSVSAWQNVGDDLGSMITSVTNTLMVLQKVQVKSEIIDMKKFLANFIPWFGGHDGAGASSSADASAKALTASTKAEMFFAGDSNKVRATLSWKAFENAGYEGGQYVQPMITFTSDNVPYTFSQYFGNDRFLSVENQYKKLADQYKSFIRYNK